MKYVDNNNVLHYTVEREVWNNIAAGKIKKVGIDLSALWLRVFCNPHNCCDNCGYCYASAPWKYSVNDKVRNICFHLSGQSDILTFRIEKISIEGSKIRWSSKLDHRHFTVVFGERVNEILDLNVQEQRWSTFTRYIIFSQKGSVIFEKHNNPLSWGGYTYIYGLWVVEKYRKNGIARQLLDKAEEIARSLGCEDVCLEWENTTPKWVFEWYIKKGYEELEWNYNGSLLIKRFDISQEQAGINNGIPYVDLGLPSGTLWATCNVGATSPEQAGLYFAFGETTGYTAGQVTSGMRKFDEASYKASGISADLTLEQDAARANLGENWRMPTYDDWQELYKNCNDAWTDDYNGTGVAGKVFTSKVNGNSVFFPAVGECYDSSVDDVGSEGGYWSASWLSSSYAWVLYFNSRGRYLNYYNRFYGHPVRGVCKR